MPDGERTAMVCGCHPPDGCHPRTAATRTAAGAARRTASRRVLIHVDDPPGYGSRPGTRGHPQVIDGEQPRQRRRPAGAVATGHPPVHPVAVRRSRSLTGADTKPNDGVPGPATPVALVTGSDAGIGRATAVRLAESGMDIGVTWHTDEEGARRTADEVRRTGRRAEIEHLDLAATGGLGLLTQVMALEPAEHGITVNSVAPGEIATPMTGQEDTDVTSVQRPGLPLGRPGDAPRGRGRDRLPRGEDASYVTGASWAVDGGMLRMGPQAGSHLPDDDWRRP
ncbi:SDR family NAD(P)-dependent oxidoreductase [Streptomyces stelliscabiei]|uniref:SDR family NAD(P)-dependent oxidoreductase n=1 Tax=Streptomyces stelliscabiei TaxID=146820 RepID=UPI002FF37EF8